MITDPIYLPSLLGRLAEFGCLCLESTPSGRPAFCGLYHGTAPADCCDALIVSIQRLFTSKQGLVEDADPLKCQTVVPAVSGIIQLFRPCWPVVRDDPHNPFPPGAETTDAAASLMIDAMQLYCCLLTDLGSRDSYILGGDPLLVKLGPFTPQQPSGGCASWRAQFSIELDACCGSPPFAPPPPGS